MDSTLATMRASTSLLLRSKLGSSSLRELCHTSSSLSQNLLSSTTTPLLSDRNAMLSIRQSLLDTSHQLLILAGDPAPQLADVQSGLQKVVSVCENVVLEMKKAGRNEAETQIRTLLKALDKLNRSNNVATVLERVHELTSFLNTFLSSVLDFELRFKGNVRQEVLARVNSIKILLPVLVLALRDSLNWPMNSHLRNGKEFFFNAVSNSLTETLKIVFMDEKGDEEETRGSFVRALDALTTWGAGSSSNISLKSSITLLIKVGVSVAQLCDSTPNSLLSQCKSLLKVTQRFQQKTSNRQEVLGTAKHLEQGVNSTLIRLIGEIFCNPDLNPLDKLIEHVLNAEIAPPSRLPEDVDGLVDEFDDFADTMFNLAHLVTFCVDAEEKEGCSAASELHTLHILEQELMPACVRLYFSHDDTGARTHLGRLRDEWRRAVTRLEQHIFASVDATAFAYVANEEVRLLALNLKKAPEKGAHQTSRIICLAQKSVDLAWRELRDIEGGLSDEHPLIKLERATWEVQEAFKQMSKDEDNNEESKKQLSLDRNKAFLRRIQALATCLGLLAHALLHHDAKTQSYEGVRVLTSVSRITIRPESMERRRIRSSESMRSLGSSFREFKKSNVSLVRSNTQLDESKIINIRQINRDTINRRTQSVLQPPFESRRMRAQKETFINDDVSMLLDTLEDLHERDQGFGDNDQFESHVSVGGAKPLFERDSENRRIHVMKTAL